MKIFCQFPIKVPGFGMSNINQVASQASLDIKAHSATVSILIQIIYPQEILKLLLHFIRQVFLLLTDMVE